MTIILYEIGVLRAKGFTGRGELSHVYKGNEGIILTVGDHALEGTLDIV